MTNVYIRHKVLVRAWEEPERKNVLFAPDDALAETTIENMQHVSSGKLTIENNTNMDIPLPDIQTVCGVMIRSDQDVNLTLNGGAEVFALKRPSAGTDDEPTYCTFFFEGLLTEINVAKPSTSPATSAEIRFCVYGNPEA